MSEQAQAQTDPWEAIAETVTSWNLPPAKVAYLAQALNAARAADAAQIATLITERDLLKRGVATVTFGDADAVIAKLVAERDAAQQEAQTLREALSDILWEVKDSSAAKKVAIAALVPRPQDRQ